MATTRHTVGRYQSRRRVGDIDAALEWYGRLLPLPCGVGRSNAFIDMGDQFINMTLVKGPERQDVEHRHIGLVVDDRSRVIRLAQALGAHGGRSVPRFPGYLGQPV